MTISALIGVCGPRDEKVQGKRGEEQIQKLTDRYVKEMDEQLAGKEKEIMEV